MISVILPTYNPDISRLQEVIFALSQQTLDLNLWEFIIIDNNSSFDIKGKIDLAWHPHSKIVIAHQQGLTYARLKGISSSSFEIIVMVDDDNLLQKDFLNQAITIFNTHQNIGAAGGRIKALFEGENYQLALHFENLLAIRDLGDEKHIESFAEAYPHYAPVGAGMVFRKCAIKRYITKISASNDVISDRKGSSLSSSGDNEMVLEILLSGWDVGYFPSLEIQHIIPTDRTTKEYLSSLNLQIQESWTKFLLKHDLCPWQTIYPSTLMLRKLKAWVTYKAWQNDVNYIKWCGACGTFNALASS